MMNRERNERKKWQGKERGIGIEERNEKRQRDREGVRKTERQTGKEKAGEK